MMDGEMMELASRVSAIEAMVAAAYAGGQGAAFGMEGPEFDVGSPPNVPIADGLAMFQWDGRKRQIGSGYVLVGRTLRRCEESEGNLEDGTYYVKVTLGANADTLEITDSGGGTQTTDDTCFLPLYRISNGKVDEDMRGIFSVQCWE